jgi:pimeloyl-ACP methyl ester carboxylesterase
MAMMPTAADDRLDPPPGDLFELPGRRTVFVRDSGPSAGPALVLLHGLMVTSDLNWFGAFEPLSRPFRVIAMDLPGHGRSPAGRTTLRLADCADDVAALARELDLPAIIPVGYSMGGLVAQLVWQRHRDLVAGLVLCSTARNFHSSPFEQLTSFSLPSLAVAAQLNPFLGHLSSGFLASLMLGHVRDPQLRLWALSEMQRTNFATTASAVDEVSRFSSHRWIRTVDVPAAVLITTRDSVIPASRQWRLAQAIPHAVVHELHDDHDVWLTAPGRFATALLSASLTVGALGAIPGPRGPADEAAGSPAERKRAL